MQISDNDRKAVARHFNLVFRAKK